MFENKDKYAALFALAFGKRPAEELYDVRKDPYQINNLAGDPQYTAVSTRLAALLANELKRTADPRSSGHGHLLDNISRKY
jgi:N-sulfoglucosamine sulfohydrolase